MESFKEWYDQEQFIEFAKNVFEENAIVANQPAMTSDKQKPWSAKKDEIIKLWTNLMPNLPIIMTPMAAKNQNGGTSSYGEDGIRITGSWPFIAGVIARIKEILNYENDSNRLRLVFKGIDSNRNGRPDRRNYAFYINLQPRSKGKPGRK